MTIEPDTKDWTWVLERPCPECDFEPAAMDVEAIGIMLRENAAAWQAVLRRSGTAQRPKPSVWSPLEYACHVRDVFRLFDERLRLMLTEDDPLYANWDQDETAIADDYASQDPAVVADELVAAASAIADRFDSVTGEQWDRRGRRSDGASFTVDTFARYFTHDWVHHLHDVSSRAPHDVGG
jgi:hypothetical protein